MFKLSFTCLFTFKLELTPSTRVTSCMPYKLGNGRICNFRTFHTCAGSPAAAGDGSAPKAKAESCFWPASKRPRWREAPSVRASCDGARLWRGESEASSGGWGAAEGPPPPPPHHPWPSCGRARPRRLPRTTTPLTKTRRRTTTKTSGCLLRRVKREAESGRQNRVKRSIKF